QQPTPSKASVATIPRTQGTLVPASKRDRTNQTNPPLVAGKINAGTPVPALISQLQTVNKPPKRPIYRPKLFFANNY
ncbi:MAG: hypothetical protein Q4D73_04265, partial [Actinomycetaceae bacterium]|nr:hypothetical protein [Actinomycetaceae bacterium]